MSTYLDSFRSLGLGFDAMFDALEAFDSLTPPRDNYPPYNLIRDGDNYTLEVALAGRKKEDIQIEFKENKLSVENVRPDATANDGYVHRGIATRYFKREWLLHDDIVVKSASLEDGMLSIKMEKVVPEEKKPKIIEIN